MITDTIRRIPRSAEASGPGHCCRARLRAGWRRGRHRAATEPPESMAVTDPSQRVHRCR